MNKKVFLLLLCFVLMATTGVAQVTVKYGTLSYDALLRSMPEFTHIETQIAKLRSQYEAEALHNEKTFNRQFAEFLQGQKDFPQSIMLKRQRDLQESMEKSIAFRRSADSLIHEARIEMERPMRARLDSAIAAVGLERGYEYMVNTDVKTYLFVHPQLSEDATPYVKQKLEGVVTRQDD